MPLGTDVLSGNQKQRLLAVREAYRLLTVRKGTAHEIRPSVSEILRVARWIWAAQD